VKREPVAVAMNVRALNVVVIYEPTHLTKLHKTHTQTHIHTHTGKTGNLGKFLVSVPVIWL
jgi:hypothetical protein